VIAVTITRREIFFAGGREEEVLAEADLAAAVAVAAVAVSAEVVEVSGAEGRPEAGKRMNADAFFAAEEQERIHQRCGDTQQS